MFYKIVDIYKDKSKTVDNYFLVFKIRKLKVENTDILSFDLEPIIFNCLKKVIVYIKQALRIPAIVKIQSFKKLY